MALVGELWNWHHLLTALTWGCVNVPDGTCLVGIVGSQGLCVPGPMCACCQWIEKPIMPWPGSLVLLTYLFFVLFWFFPSRQT